MTTLRRILHVDDDADIREIARLSLEELGGFVLLQCATIMEAIEKAKHFEPDLLLLDMTLPDGDGDEILDELQKSSHLADTPAILLTAKEALAEQLLEVRDQVIGSVSKPFDPIDLPERILEAFRQRLL